MAETNQPQEASEELVSEEIQDEVYEIEEEDEEVRKFQSLYDRSQAENQKLESQVREMEKFKPLVNLLENRPDLVSMIQENIAGRGQQEKTMTEDEFNPWDAYYKPESPSYKLRMKDQQKMVDSTVGRHMSALQEQMFVNNLQTDLKSKYNFTNDQAGRFVKFFSQPKENLSIETLVDVFLKNENETTARPNSSLDQVRANKQSPRSPGVIQGQQPETKSGKDKMWDQVINAGSRTNVL
jgi:hypothetical protein|tara:strand:- start:1961 stop:2677 length:717 start_codon:yes stop_codon:yes gene_type:complete